MANRRQTRHSSEFKERVVQRLLAGENVRAVAHELLVSRGTLFEWRLQAERRLGQQEARPFSEVQALRARIVELEAEVGRTMLERDFLAGALRRTEAAMGSSGRSGKKTSVPKSADRWNRKAN